MRLPAGLLLALLATVAGAQEADQEFTDSWYRIELLIFANRDPEAALAERWPLLPQLTYPESWQRLENGSARIPANQAFDLLTVEDSAQAGTLDLFWERSTDELLREFRQKQLLQRPQLVLEPLVEMETALDVPRQRVLLPAEARELNGQRRRIDNSAGLEVLMHQSWLQRIPARDVAQPLILDGPVQFGDYPELQGSVLFYSGRYLHIATDLWLNTAGSYLDENPTSAGWSMPRPPLPVDQSPAQLLPFRVETDDEWFADLYATTTYPLFSDDDVGDDGSDLVTEDDADSTLGSDDFMDDTEPEGGISVLMVPADELADEEAFEPFEELEASEEAMATEAPSHPPASEAEMEAFLALPVYDYEFRHAVRVAQQRRMRSGELHYIDHPLLGIVVKVSRHEFLPFTNLDEFNEN